MALDHKTDKMPKIKDPELTESELGLQSRGLSAIDPERAEIFKRIFAKAIHNVHECIRKREALKEIRLRASGLPLTASQELDDDPPKDGLANFVNSCKERVTEGFERCGISEEEAKRLVRDIFEEA